MSIILPQILEVIAHMETTSHNRWRCFILPPGYTTRRSRWSSLGGSAGGDLLRLRERICDHQQWVEKTVRLRPQSNLQSVAKSVMARPLGCHNRLCCPWHEGSHSEGASPQTGGI